MQPLFTRTSELDIKATTDRLQRLYEETYSDEMAQACYHLITLIPVVRMSLKSLLNYIDNMPDKKYSGHLLHVLKLTAVERVK